MFTWQNGRELAMVEKNGVVTSYVYNADGGRHAKTVGGVVTQYITIDGVLYGEKTGNNTLVYYYDDKGVPYAFTYNNVKYYYEYNLMGDVIGLFDNTGNRVVRYYYTPYGALQSMVDNTTAGIGSINPIRYRGYYYDVETGFYYCGSRYYDPEIGRWINADSITDGGAGVLGYNLFMYAANNPINNSDVTGRWIIKDAIKWLTKNVFAPVTNFVKKTTSMINGTRTIGFSASATSGIGGSISIGLTTDNKGNIGFVATAGGIGGTPSASAGVFRSITSAPDIYKQKGPAYPTGGSLDAYGISVGAEYTLFTDSETDDIYHGVAVLAGVGAAMPLEIHTGVSYSKIWGFNIYETLEKLYVKLMEW